jgi:hypothetical protein
MPDVGHPLRVRVRTLVGFAGVRAVSRVSGVHESHVHQAVAGGWIPDHVVNPLARVRLEDLAPRVTQVYCGGLALRAGALNREGWNLGTIAYRFGMDRARLKRIMDGEQRKVRSHTWAGAVQASRRMVRQRPDPYHAQAAMVAAREKGYLRFVELEEELIDLAEPWRTEEVERRALLELEEDFHPKVVSQGKERSEVLRRALQIYNVRLERARAERLKEEQRG